LCDYSAYRALGPQTQAAFTEIRFSSSESQFSQPATAACQTSEQPGTIRSCGSMQMPVGLVDPSEIPTKQSMLAALGIRRSSQNAGLRHSLLRPLRRWRLQEPTTHDAHGKRKLPVASHQSEACQLVSSQTHKFHLGIQTYIRSV